MQRHEIASVDHSIKRCALGTIWRPDLKIPKWQPQMDSCYRGSISGITHKNNIKNSKGKAINPQAHVTNTCRQHGHKRNSIVHCSQ